MRPLFGVCLVNFGNHVSASSLIKSAEESEEMGYDSVWATDHLLMPSSMKYPYGRIIEPLAAMAVAASTTEDVKIGSSVIILPMRQPVQVAKALASIDLISGGRVIAGFGAGWCREEFQNLGVDFHNRGRRFDEAIALVKALWKGGEVSFKGRYYNVEAGFFEPTPAQKNSIPIWVGGNSEKALKRALTLAEGWHFTGLPVERAEHMLKNIKIPEGFVVSGRLTVDFSGKSPRLTKSRSGEERAIVSGDVDYVVETLSNYVDLGVSYFVLYFGDKPIEQYVKDMERFVREVAPSYV
ncbi:MAG: LLM class F420-dependent oxidoreductase [Candidatus Caldarchaeum sp.]|nr:LLM class F420-dependent oxidoreductase [Candidatus Caldarchaeum sp.]